MLEYKRIEIEFVWKKIRMEQNKYINRQTKFFRKKEKEKSRGLAARPAHN